MLEGAIDARAFNTVRSSGKSLVIKSSKPDVLKGECCLVTDGKYMKKQHHQFFLLNHGNLNMDGFFLEWNLIFPETWLLGSMLNFRGASRRGRFIWTFNSYTPATFFFWITMEWNPCKAPKSNPCKTPQTWHLLSGISNNKGQDSRMLLGCVCVSRKSNCCRLRSLVSEHPSRIGHALSTSHGNFGGWWVRCFSIHYHHVQGALGLKWWFFFDRRKSGSEKKGELFWVK